MNRTYALTVAALTTALLSACSTSMPSSAELDKLTHDIIARSFRAEGQAQLDRVSPDDDNRLCAESDLAGVALDAKVGQAIEARNMATIMGGPNVVRGGSHSGNVSAIELARLGLVDILSSDYVPGSLLSAVVRLTETAGLSLPQAVALASRKPAQSIGLHDRGAIAPGLRADLVQVRMTALADLLPWLQALAPGAKLMACAATELPPELVLGWRATVGAKAEAGAQLAHLRLQIVGQGHQRRAGAGHDRTGHRSAVRSTTRARKATSSAPISAVKPASSAEPKARRPVRAGSQRAMRTMAMERISGARSTSSLSWPIDVTLTSTKLCGPSGAGSSGCAR